MWLTLSCITHNALAYLLIMVRRELTLTLFLPKESNVDMLLFCTSLRLE